MHSTAPILIAAGLVGLAAEARPAATAADGPLVIKASRIHVGDGTVIENGTVVVVEGRIQAVGAQVDVPNGAVVVEHDGDLSAGLIALSDAAGVGAEGRDITRQSMPDAELVHAFDADHSDYDRLVSEGVTTVVLTPSAGPVIGGVTAAVKPGAGRVLKRRAHLHASFAASSLSFGREPTSYTGLTAVLEALFAEPKGSIDEAVKGRLSVLLEADSKAEMQRAIAFARKHSLAGAILGGGRSGELATDIRAAGLSVILDTYRAGRERRSLASAKVLAEAGVPFGYALDSPGRHPANLRLTAAASIREGLDPAVAWRALTSDAARIAGVDANVGSVAVGKDADLVLWTGNPTDLGSRVVAVYVDGERVHGGDE